MNKYVNPDGSNFLKQLKEEIYIDKTLYINTINYFINDYDYAYAMYLPRGFGKTSLANMVLAYISIGANSRELFSNKKIANTPDWDINLNKHNVIFVDMEEIANMGPVEEFFNILENEVITELKENFPNVAFDAKDDLIDCISEINEATGSRFAFIFDNYDIIFRDEKYKEYREKYLSYLNSIAKNGNFDSCVSLVYFTGILPIYTGLHLTTLNNFSTNSLIESHLVEDIIGFTEDEVKVICEKYNSKSDINTKVDFEKLKLWYGGYTLEDGSTVFNPYAIKTFFDKDEIEYDSIWCNNSLELNKKIVLHTERVDPWKKETDEWFKIKYLNKIVYEILSDGFYNDIINLVDTGENGDKKNSISMEPLPVVSSVEYFYNKRDIFNYLIHFGYLAYNPQTRECFIPNEDIAKDFKRIIGQSTTYINLIRELDKVYLL